MKARAGSTKRIDQFDLNGTFIQYFWGGREAAKWLVEQGLAKSINSKRHIIDCCNNKCPHAYHYIWKFHHYNNGLLFRYNLSDWWLKAL